MRSGAARTSSTSTPSTWSISADEQRHQAGVGELDDQLVDGPARAPLEDVDADHVAPDRADAAGDRAQRSRTVGQPHPHDERLHGLRPYGRGVNGGFRPRDDAATGAATGLYGAAMAPNEKPEVTVAGGEPPAELVIEDIEVGDGKEAKPGADVEVHYVGVAWSNGRQFDASWDRRQTFKFRLGAGMVIGGWDQGVAGMKVGGRRRLTIPPELGYGARGAGGAIEPQRDPRLRRRPGEVSSPTDAQPVREAERAGGAPPLHKAARSGPAPRGGVPMTTVWPGVAASCWSSRSCSRAGEPSAWRAALARLRRAAVSPRARSRAARPWARATRTSARARLRSAGRTMSLSSSWPTATPSSSRPRTAAVSSAPSSDRPASSSSTVWSRHDLAQRHLDGQVEGAVDVLDGGDERRRVGHLRPGRRR